MDAKLFMTDIDGTIVGKGEDLSNEIVELFQYLRNKGIKFCCNTARPYLRAKDILYHIQTTAPNVLSMGSEYRDGNGKLVHVEYMTIEAKDAIADLITEANPESITFYTNGELNPKVYATTPERLDYLGKRYYANGSGMYSEQHKFLKLWKLSNPSVCLLRILDSAELEFKKILNRYSDNFEVSNIEKGTYIFTNKNVNKGYGVKIVSDMLGIKNDSESIITAGDATTDEAMYTTTSGIHVNNLTSNIAKYRATSTVELMDLVYELVG